MEYKEVHLTPVPELTTGQMEIIHGGFSGLFVGGGLVFLFAVFAVFLFRLLGGKGLK